MPYFFLILLILAPIALIIGLIRPITFSKILRSKSRKQIGKVFVSLFLVSFIGLAITVPKTTPKPEDEKLIEIAATSQVASVPNDPASEIDEQPVKMDAGSVAASEKTSTAPVQNQVTKSDLYYIASVVDGDTLKVLIDGTEKTVRLIGVDTPETVDPRKPVQCFGKEASNKTRSVLLGKLVRLEIDPSQGETDKYSRLLRYVYLEDGTLFNKMIIEQGFAYEYTYNKPYKFQLEFKAAQRSAQEAKIGLWSPVTCNGTTVATTTESTTQSQPTVVSDPVSESVGGHVFYLSTYRGSVYYYCDTDDGWKGLDSKYLKSYTSDAALLKDYPNRKLHETCN